MILISLMKFWLVLVLASSAAAPTNLLSEYLLNPFVLAILVFFIFSLLRLGSYVRQLPLQRTALEQVSANYVEVDRQQETEAELIRQDLIRGVDENSLVVRRINELHHIGIHSGDFDQVALAEVLAARENAKISIARYVASVLVLLGLCGAIWGLSGLIRNMSPALSDVQVELDKNSPSGPSTSAGPATEPANSTAAIQDSFKKLINTMSDSLASTRGAFYASMTGILASIVLLLCNWFAARQQINFLAALEDLTATRLIPIFKPAPEAAQLAEAVTAFREGSNYLVHLSDELDNKVSQAGTSMENLFAIVRKFGEGADTIRAHQDQVYQAQQQMLGVVNQFVGLTTRIEANQSTTHADVETVVQKMGESNQNVTRTLEDWHAKHEEMLQTIERNARQSHQATKEARDISQQGITELTNLIRSSWDNQAGTLRAQALELFEMQQVSTGKHLDQLIERQSTFVSQLQEAVGRTDGHQALLAGLATAMNEERRGFESHMQQMLDQSGKSLNALLGEQKQIMDITSLRRVERSLEQFVSENRTEFAGLVHRQTELDQQLSQLSQIAGRLSSMIRILIGVATVTVPVFAALGVMYIFDFRPEDQIMRVVSLLVIVLMVFLLAWFLRSKT